MTTSVVIEPAVTPIPAGGAPAIGAATDIQESGFRDAIPRQPHGHELVTRAVAAIGLLYGVYWIAWRWTYSLNPNALVFSLVLVIAETYGLINSCLMVFTVWKLNYRVSPPAPRGLSVDVFIT